MEFSVLSGVLVLRDGSRMPYSIIVPTIFGDAPRGKTGDVPVHRYETVWLGWQGALREHPGCRWEVIDDVSVRQAGPEETAWAVRHGVDREFGGR